MTATYHSPGHGAHQNTREQRFAFCSGLGFTFGYSGSIVLALGGRGAALRYLATVRLSLRWEANSGMLGEP